MLPQVADIIFCPAEISAGIPPLDPAMLVVDISAVSCLSCVCASDALSGLVANDSCPWWALDGRGVNRDIQSIH